MSVSSASSRLAHSGSAHGVGLLEFLRPGLRLKRWLCLFILGLVLISLGAAYLLVDLYRTVQAPAWVGAATLQFLPQPARAVLFAVAGAGVCWTALVGLYRSLSDVVVRSGPNGNGGTGLLRLVYESRVRMTGPRVVCVGGGTGMPSVLRGLKAHTSNITAVVTVGDDGGSSGRLRREHGILPPGDFRNNIVALAEVEPLMARLFQYRFGGGSALEGHSFGNLFVLAMAEVTGNFEQGLRETSRVLAVKGTILPSTLEDVSIGARFSDGSEVLGESQVPEAAKPIERIFLRPEHPPAQPEAVKAILEADLVVLGPGSLYTSVIPNLLVEGVAKALLQTEALKVYVCNVATQPGETDGFDVEAHVRALADHMPGGRCPVDVVIANHHPPAAVSPDSRVTLVRPNVSGGGVLPGAPRLVTADVVRSDNILRHDSEKLTAVLLQVYEDWRRARRRR